MGGVVTIGLRRAEEMLSSAGHAIMLLWESIKWLRSFWGRRKEIVYQTYIYGVGGFPVTMLVAVFVGMVMTFQIGLYLLKFGQESSVGAIVAVSMCRELGPVWTGVILAGLLGSKMAAELGTMAVGEEIDALEVMSINPIRFLVMPRVVAMCIMCPVLTAYSDLIGIVSGMLVAGNVLHVEASSYMSSARSFLEFGDFYSGLMKSLVFGLTIAAVGCSQGLRAQRGAEGVGIATMKTVVICCVLILLLDYVLGWVAMNFLGVGAV